MYDTTQGTTVVTHGDCALTRGHVAGEHAADVVVEVTHRLRRTRIRSVGVLVQHSTWQDRLRTRKSSDALRVGMNSSHAV